MLSFRVHQKANELTAGNAAIVSLHASKWKDTAVREGDVANDGEAQLLSTLVSPLGCSQNASPGSLMENTSMCIIIGLYQDH